MHKKPKSNDALEKWPAEVRTLIAKLPLKPYIVVLVDINSHKDTEPRVGYELALVQARTPFDAEGELFHYRQKGAMAVASFDKETLLEMIEAIDAKSLAAVDWSDIQQDEKYQ